MKPQNNQTFNLNLRRAKTSHYDNVQVIQDSDERIYDRTYVHALINNRLVKLLKESVKYD